MATRKAATKKNEVAQAETGAEQLPAFLQGHMNDNRGSEEVEANDLVIPRIELVQGLSKARKKSDPAYIEGAEEGMLYNNVTRELYGDSIKVCPVLFRKEWLLWRDSDLGGGFGGAYASSEEAEAAKADQEKPEEWEVVDTNQHFVILMKEDGMREEAVISMAKTKAKCSRLWNSLVRINGGPRFSRFYQLQGIAEQNNKGQDYHSLQVKNIGFVDEKTFRYAEDVYNLVKSGVAKVDQTFDFGDDESGDTHDAEM